MARCIMVRNARAFSTVPLLSTSSLATSFLSEDLATSGLVWNLGMMGWSRRQHLRAQKHKKKHLSLFVVRPYLQNKVSPELYFFWKFLDFSSFSLYPELPKGRFPEPKSTCTLEVSTAKRKLVQVFEQHSRGMKLYY